MSNDISSGPFMSKFYKRIYGSFSTYDSLQTKWPIIIKFIEEFNDKLVIPLKMKLMYYLEGYRIRPKEYLYDIDWEKAKNKIHEGKIQAINFGNVVTKNVEEIRTRLESPKEYFPNEFIRLNVFLNTLEDENGIKPKTASLIEFSIMETLYPGGIPSYVYHYYVELLEKLTHNIECVGGMITLDVMSTNHSFSSHERHMGLTYLSASTNFADYFRGYSWGNFLSKNHVKVLGGIERIKKEAPVYFVKGLNDGGAYLQLTEDINIVSDDDLRKLKKYFEPILPKAPLRLNPRESYFRRMIIDDDDEIRFLQNKQ